MKAGVKGGEESSGMNRWTDLVGLDDDNDVIGSHGLALRFGPPRDDALCYRLTERWHDFDDPPRSPCSGMIRRPLMWCGGA